MRGTTIILAALLGAASAGCATTYVPAVGDEPFVLEDDERRIWSDAEEEQRRLESAGFVYDDSLATAYVNRLLVRLTPPRVIAAGLTPRAVLLKNPLLNAFAYPNGRMYFHTGILSRVENEAQLATLIGHELSHVLKRHTLRHIRATRNTQDALAFLGVVTIPFGFYGGMIGLLGSVGGLAAVTGYSRELEAEADASGFDLMVAAGYDPNESPLLFEYLKADLEEWQVEEPFFFGSHPRLVDRIENFRKRLQEMPPSAAGFKGAGTPDTMFVRLNLVNAELDLAMGRYGSAVRSSINVLRLDSTCSMAHWISAEVLRQGGDSAHVDSALAEYRSAVQCDSTNARAYRGMGVLWMKNGHCEEAHQAFSRYLELLPGAPDRKYIEQYLQQLEDRKGAIQ